jgi:hypothetical protein
VKRAQLRARFDELVRDDNDLAAVVEVIEDAMSGGTGVLSRPASGGLVARDPSKLHAGCSEYYW